MKVKTKHFLLILEHLRVFNKKLCKNDIKILNYNLQVKFDKNKKYDGVYSKVLDTKIAKRYGWKPKLSFKKAILNTYKDLVKIMNLLETISEIRI